jgi:hypothetical protein
MTTVTDLAHRPAGLHVRRVGLDVSRDIQFTRGDLEMGSRFARIPLRWADARRPSLFPVLDAVLEIYPAVHDTRQMTELAGRLERDIPPDVTWRHRWPTR